MESDEAEKRVELVDPMYACDDVTFYTVNSISLVFIVTTACCVDDLSLVFGIIAGCNESMMDFVFPGVFFICGLKYANKTNLRLTLVVVMFIFVGVSIFVASNYFNLKKVMDD